jgi:hypothetical protein
VNGVLNKLVTQIEEVTQLSQTFDYSQENFSFFKK